MCPICLHYLLKALEPPYKYEHMSKSQRGLDLCERKEFLLIDSFLIPQAYFDDETAIPNFIKLLLFSCICDFPTSKITRSIQ